MKVVKVIVIPVILAIVIYGIIMFIQRGNKPHSPLPEEGIKVIQVTPNK